MSKNKNSSNQPSTGLIKPPRRKSKWMLGLFVALFAFLGVVVILRSFASTTPPCDHNDVLQCGFSTANTKTAQDEVILKLLATNSNPGAKSLFARYGVGDDEIRKASLVDGFDPHDPNSGYYNWYSFGRVNYGKPGTTAVSVGGATFYYKQVKYAWSASTHRTAKILKGTTKDGRTFLIHSECGNLVISGTTPFQGSPHATIVKQAVSPAANATVKPGDTIKYRLTATSDGNTNAYVTIADVIPLGTTFVTAVVETGNALPLPNDKVGNQEVRKWANYGLAPGAVVKILVTVRVNSNTTSGFCNTAYITWQQNQTIPAKSASICHNVGTTGSPILKVDKVATDIKAGSEVKPGDVITYKVTGQNLGTANSTNAAIWDGIQDKGWFEFVSMGPLQSAGKNVPASEIAETVKAKPSQGWKYWGYTKKVLKPKETVQFTIKFKVVLAGDPALKVCDLAIIADSRPSPYGVWGYDQVCHAVIGVEKHKSAIFLNRKGADGKPLIADGKNVAKAGDELEYTLATKNLGAATLKAYAITEDLNDVLEYADVTDNGGGSLANGIMTWKADIAVGQTNKQVFKIKVKSPIPNQQGKSSSPNSYDYKMVNIYGDTVEVPVEKPIVQTIIDTLPQTGALGFIMIPLALATLLLLAYTSGLLGIGGSHRRHAKPVDSASIAPSAHKPGDQFHPNPDRDHGDKTK